MVHGEKRLELATGLSEDFKAYNIYDLAGNMWEWTTEIGERPSSNNGSASTPNCDENKCESATNAVLRGGGFDSVDSNVVPVVCANGGNGVGGYSFNFSFRSVLYLK